MKVKHWMSVAGIALVVSVCTYASTTAEPSHAFFTSSEMQWVPGPASLPAGAMMTVLEGNPAKPGPFTMRIRFPSDYKIPPHWHPGIEHITILSGSLNIGTGDNFDLQNVKTLPEGSFFYMSPKMHHYGYTREGVTIQFHGIGPWDIIYLNPKDDPRKKH